VPARNIPTHPGRCTLHTFHLTKNGEKHQWNFAGKELILFTILHGICTAAILENRSGLAIDALIYPDFKDFPHLRV
jgi:hypothetical protein